MRLNIVVVLLILMFSVNNVMCQESAPALKDNTFVMAFIRPETQYTGKWQRLIYAEVFKRLGIKAEFRDYPVKRASIEADAGNVDGEAGRIYPYAVEHPNLIRVEESLFFMIFSAFGIKPSISQLSGWDSLKGKNYKVEYRRGTQLCEINLFKVMNRENISEVTDTEQGIKKLISGRTDLFVEDEVSVLSLMQMTEFKGSKIRTVGIMESFPLYLYLHKKHAALVPKMAEIIKAIKAEGLIEQYRMMVEKEFDIVRK